MIVLRSFIAGREGLGKLCCFLVRPGHLFVRAIDIEMGWKCPYKVGDGVDKGSCGHTELRQVLVATLWTELCILDIFFCTLGLWLHGIFRVAGDGPVKGSPAAVIWGSARPKILVHERILVRSIRATSDMGGLCLCYGDAHRHAVKGVVDIGHVESDLGWRTTKHDGRKSGS
jgi:hypothetical protein